MFRYNYPPLPTVSVSPAPVEFNYNNVATIVSQDTVTPANSKPLPAILLDSNGVPVDFSSLITASSPLAYTVFDIAASNIDDTAYVQLLATIGVQKTKKAQIFMSSGEPLYLAFGGSGSEVNKLVIIPGGNGFIDLDIPANTRLSAKAVNPVTVSSGVIIINLLG